MFLNRSDVFYVIFLHCKNNKFFHSVPVIESTLRSIMSRNVHLAVIDLRSVRGAECNKDHHTHTVTALKSQRMN